MPGMARSCSSVRYASLSVACAIVSDAFRYARILNGFSLLISSRSAISEKMRAMARFSMFWEQEFKRLGGSQHRDAEQDIDVAPPARDEKKIAEIKSQNAAALDFGDLLLVAWAASRPTTSMSDP